MKGALALSKDLSGGGDTFGAIRNYPNLKITKITQEIGVIEDSNPQSAIDLSKFPIGSQLLIIPNHSWYAKNRCCMDDMTSRKKENIILKISNSSYSATASYLLHLIYCILFIASYLLHLIYCILFTTSYLLHLIYCILFTASYLLFFCFFLF